ncbi:hypothetical protein [Cytobacillus firmus]|uniref:Uncharacterized protein n=1 Tax=Cytobacillus firmus DS1 TaxID=1307436 RepID=W7L8R1_CYTFI|nr:hypothetical protein [Cytobacillus firmus]EWG11612.1 hypothetical protein PBF_08668 [Cytobacillus firmus DS1]
MRKGNLPRSEQIRDLIALPTPCNDTVYYPANLAILGTQGKYSVFMTMSHKSGQAYIAVTQPDRVRFRLGGSPEQMSDIYESIPWPEVEMSDGNGNFFYKIAPSLQELEDYFNNFDE